MESVKPYAHELLVVDDNSTDGTSEIAQQWGAKVIQHAFKGYSDQKQFGVNQASHDWVWILDSDEYVSEKLGMEVQNTVGNENDIKGYKVPNQLVFLGAPLRFGPDAKQYNLRIFHKKCGHLDGKPVHEKVILHGKWKALQHVTWHHSYQSISHYIEKMNRYSSLYADSTSQKIYILHLIFKMPFEFIRFWIFKGLIFDGFRGWVWSALSAWSAGIKYLKAYEKQHK